MTERKEHKKRDRDREAASGKTKSRRKQRRDKKRAQQVLEAGPDAVTSKLLKWAQRGKNAKLASLLDACGASAAGLVPAVQDVLGRTLLHHASAGGHLDTIRTLLRHGAPVAARDLRGATPAHAAAAAGQLLAVQALLQGRQDAVDMDEPDASGNTIRGLLSHALGDGLEPPPLRAAPPPHPRGGTSSESSGAAWRRRLAEEASDGEGGGTSGWDHDTTSDQVQGVADEDGLWADRMWAEMQNRRRAQARASASMFASSAREAWAAHREEQQRMHAERLARLKAAEETLRAAQAEDARWRQRVLQGGEAGPAPPPAPDPATARADYEARWSAMDTALASRPRDAAPLLMADIAWPLPPGTPYTVDTLQCMLLHGVKGPADIRQRLRSELMRWHPDKFSARIGPHVAPSASAGVMARVQEVSQCLTAMMTG